MVHTDYLKKYRSKDVPSWGEYLIPELEMEPNAVDHPGTETEQEAEERQERVEDEDSEDEAMQVPGKDAVAPDAGRRQRRKPRHFDDFVMA